MRPHPKPSLIRKTIKWGGAAVTVLLVVVWIGSGWWVLQFVRSDGAGAALGRGVFVAVPSKGWCYVIKNHLRLIETERPGIFEWGFGQTYPVQVPLWIPVVLCGVPAIIAWRLDARARRRESLGRCPKCNYDRTGLDPGVVCPECGSTPT